MNRNAIGPIRPNFKTGKTVSHGYVVLTSKVHGENTGRREHRVVMESVLGRPLRPDELVHHRNGNRSDNRPSNLELTTRKAHPRLHGKGTLLVCRGCKAGRWFQPALLARLATDASTYQCRACSNANGMTKACRKCGASFVGGIPARFCPECSPKNRGRRFR